MVDRDEAPVRSYSVSICDQCIRLEGEECHNEDCVFWLKSMDEVREYLNVLIICPIVDGERVNLTEVR